MSITNDRKQTIANIFSKRPFETIRIREGETTFTLIGLGEVTDDEIKYLVAKGIITSFDFNVYGLTIGFKAAYETRRIIKEPLPRRLDLYKTLGL